MKHSTLRFLAVFFLLFLLAPIRTDASEPVSGGNIITGVQNEHLYQVWPEEIFYSDDSSGVPEYLEKMLSDACGYVNGDAGQKVSLDTVLDYGDADFSVPGFYEVKVTLVAPEGYTFAEGVLQEFKVPIRIKDAAQPTLITSFFQQHLLTQEYLIAMDDTESWKETYGYLENFLTSQIYGISEDGERAGIRLISFDVSALDGKTVTAFGFELTASEELMGMNFLLGQIAITDGVERPAGTASDLTVVDTSFDDEDCIYAGVKLSWSADSQADYYEIYRVNQDESLSLVGVTTATTHYINALERNDDTNKTNFQVVPVNITGERGTASNVATMDWPDNSLPKADFKASTTLAAPGQEITFESLCSANTETLAWEFPGASVETSTDAAPVVSYAAEGTYTVKVTAKNASGEAVAEKVDLITVSSKVTGDLTLLSQGKETSASAYVNDNEAPPFAVDGDVTKKWCATGNPPHELTVDLGDVKTVCQVRISHAEAGGGAGDQGKCNGDCDYSASHNEIPPNLYFWFSAVIPPLRR